MPTPRYVAEFAARQIVLKLEPFSERIQIAGSIRRKRPQVNDIDIVAIPKIESSGLFGEAAHGAKESAFYREAMKLFTPPTKAGEKMLAGLFSPAGGDVKQSGLFKVDIFLATPETWATLLLIRTGSPRHNVELCKQAEWLGMKLHADGSGLETVRPIGRPHPRIVCETEEEIFAALRVPYKPPEAR